MDLICAIDEVGRGPVAGPISACAAIFEVHNHTMLDRGSSPIPGVKDSKKFSSRKAREAVAKEILLSQLLVAYSCKSVSAEDIDLRGIESANYMAFDMAYRDVIEMARKYRPSYEARIFVIVDGNKPLKTISNEVQVAIPKADDLFWPVGAASILAKTYRDDMMDQYHYAHPAYGWNENSGYGTKKHLSAIATHGLTPYHRRSFLTKLKGQP